MDGDGAGRQEPGPSRADVLKATLLGLPVSRLLGMTRADVPVYGSGGFTTYNEPAARAQLERWTGEWAILDAVRRRP